MADFDERTTWGCSRVEGIEVVFPVVVALETEACGGRRKPPKLRCLRCCYWNCRSSFAGEEKWTAGVKGKLVVMIREVLGGRLAFHGGERESRGCFSRERERDLWTEREEDELFSIPSVFSFFYSSSLPLQFSLRFTPLCVKLSLFFFFIFSPFSLGFSSVFCLLFLCFPACWEPRIYREMHAFCVCVWRGCAESRGSRCRGAEVCCGVFCRGTGAAEPWLQSCVSCTVQVSEQCRKHAILMLGKVHFGPWNYNCFNCIPNQF